jgi:alpha-L-rhamnosidase
VREELSSKPVVKEAPVQEGQVERSRLLSLVLAVIILASAAFATPVRLRCEYLENPLGIDMASPHLSWQSDNTERNWKQIAYEVLVSSTSTGKADIWDSGKIDSGESVGIAYNGPALHSRKRYF